MGEKGRTPASRESPPPPPPPPSASAPPPPFHSVAQHGWSAAEVSRLPPAASASCARAPRLRRRRRSEVQKPRGQAVVRRQHVGRPGRELGAGGCQVRSGAAAGGLRAAGCGRREDLLWSCARAAAVRRPERRPGWGLVAVDTEAAGPRRPGAPWETPAVGVRRWPAEAPRQVPRAP